MAKNLQEKKDPTSDFIKKRIDKNHILKVIPPPTPPNNQPAPNDEKEYSHPANCFCLHFHMCP